MTRFYKLVEKLTKLKERNNNFIQLLIFIVNEHHRGKAIQPATIKQLKRLSKHNATTLHYFLAYLNENDAPRSRKASSR